MKSGQCVFCGGALDLLDHSQPGRHEDCPHCHRDLHCCRQCRFYDTAYHNACREPRAEMVSDKVAANFCDWFEFHGDVGTAGAEHTQAEAAKQRLKELFK